MTNASRTTNNSNATRQSWVPSAQTMISSEGRRESLQALENHDFHSMRTSQQKMAIGNRHSGMIAGRRRGVKGPKSRASHNRFSGLEKKMHRRGQELPDFLDRESQVAAIVQANTGIADAAKQQRDCEDGPKRRMGEIRGQLGLLNGKGKKGKKGKKSKREDALPAVAAVPEDPQKKAELKAVLEAKLVAEMERMKKLSAAIKPAEKRAKNVANFRAILQKKKDEAQKKREKEEMKKVKQQKEAAAKAAEAKKGELIAASQASWAAAPPLVKRIMGILESVIYRPLHGDEFDSIGRGALAARIQKTVDAGEELLLYMLAFPFKSKSAAKVIGTLPDLAEEAALQTLGNLLAQLNAVYPPGARYVIISDGVVFHDVYGVRDDLMLSYLLKVQEMCHAVHPKLECRSMYDFFPEQVCKGVRASGTDIEQWFDEKQIRSEVFDVYMPTPRWVQLQKEIDVGFKNKGSDFQKFLFEDADPALFPNDTQRNKAAKAGAQQMLQRDEALRIFTMGALPNAIRVSIRPRSQAGPTYCINMIGATQREMGEQLEEVVDLTTPWHNVLVRLDDESSAEAGTTRHLQQGDRVFYLRHRFVPAFAGAAPLIDAHGKVQGYSIPSGFEGVSDPTKDADPVSLPEYSSPELPTYPTEEQARARRRQAVENAVRFGWSQAVTDALKHNGDRILEKEITRTMIRFGAGGDAVVA